MDVTVREPGKFGRRAPKRAPSLKLASFLTGVVPAHPPAADYLANMGGRWDMLGNDVAGNCVAVTWANVRRLVTTMLTNTPSYPRQAEVWQIYQTQNPSFNPAGTEDTDGPGSSADNGMDIQTLLDHLIQQPGPDGSKAVAYAAINPANPDEVKAAIAIFGYVWTGVDVQNANMEEFAKSEPWSWTPGGKVVGGHSVVTGGYGWSPTAPIGEDERFITWAVETGFTDEYWSHGVDEAWVVIWPEHFGNIEFLAGVNLAQLQADYKEITGEELTVQVTPGMIQQLSSP
jgi:hypothetical protein